ncbi:MAG: hypothetical protein ACR2IL_02190 [Chitinophagaceae bacterium]
MISNSVFSQNIATYNDVITKIKKGAIDQYVTQSGEVFKVGDTIKLGTAFRNDYFDNVYQNAGIQLFPLSTAASYGNVIIKKIRIEMKIVVVNTSKPEGLVYGLTISNLETVLKNGEVKSKIMSSDDALTELKKWKEKLELGLINEEDFKRKKGELSQYIK